MLTTSSKTWFHLCFFNDLEGLALQKWLVFHFEEEPDADEGASASEWAVWIATGVLCAGAYARHGLVVALLYWLSTAALCALDPSLHSLQLLNLAAVVYDLSFELHRLYILVSNRPLLMVVILGVALAVEWLLERYEE